MDFNSLIFNDAKDRKENNEKIYAGNKRYVIGYDPCDDDAIKARQEGKFVYTIFDRANSRVQTKVWTKKTFNDFVESYIPENEKSSYMVSKKFIGNNGKPLTPEQVRSRA